MSQTFIERRKDFLIVNRIQQIEKDIRDLRMNQVHSAVTEIQMNINATHEFTNLQIWAPLNDCRAQIVFSDWIYQNFYYEVVMCNNSGSSVHHTAEARLYDYINNTEFVGSTVTTTAFASPDIVRSGLLTKPSQTGTYRFREELGIDVGGTPDSYADLYMGRLIIRYEGA